MAFLAASRRGARELARMLALASKVWPWITKLRVGRGDYAVNHNEFVCRDGREHAVFRGRRNFHQSFLAVDGKNAVTNVKLTRRHLKLGMKWSGVMSTVLPDSVVRVRNAAGSELFACGRVSTGLKKKLPFP
eukprot:CAMPEP_0171632118 /NCGR_PEP_ID=MMETSP0990-20121206/24166_1 /TAXON_ID=483369 /ORGANISM="non described non described, Strain CCMP2098" /LENGTH=131 /DNA_ID=CAMNT_0012202081 /DNA_START=267 /DNA_END=658 /DNA_ORIENTATION=+